MKKKKIQKTNAMRQLENHGIGYNVHQYAWNDDNEKAQNDADETGMPFHKIYKTMVATGSNTGEIVACIPAGTKLDLKKLAEASGNKKVDMLDINALEKTTGYVRGGCSPVGMKKSFPTFLAQSAAELDTIVVSAGKRGMQVELAPDDLLEITDGEYADIT